MGEQTAIAWTDHTFNPWWGCTRVSPGCEHCYAEAFAKRTGKAEWGKNAERRFFGDKHWAEPLKWDRQAAAAGERRLVFCASMADVFEDRKDLVTERHRLFDLIEATPNLTWQLLTKRPENVMRLAPLWWTYADGGVPGSLWPANVWIGTTVEDQKRADERLPHLVGIPAPVRFLSCEPLLGPVDLSPWLRLEWMDALRLVEEHRTFRTEDGDGGWGREMFALHAGLAPGIDWLIAGGESGGGHRPLDIAHARDLREQCAAADVPFFFKQVGGRTPTAGGDLLDGVQIKEFPRG